MTSPRWTCPECGMINDKGAFQTMYEERIAKGDPLEGTETCMGCRASISRQEVYTGTLDAVNGAGYVAPSEQAAPVGDPEISVGWRERERALREEMRSITQGKAGDVELLAPKWVELAEVYLEEGSPDSVSMALQALQGALTARSDHIPALGRLARLHASMGRPQEAIPLLHKVLKRNPYDEEALHSLFGLYLAQPSRDELRAWFVAEALVLLKAATKEERALFKEGSGRSRVEGKRLARRMWSEGLLKGVKGDEWHGFAAALAPPMAAVKSRRFEDYGLKKEQHLGADATVSVGAVHSFLGRFLGLVLPAYLRPDLRETSIALVWQKKKYSRVLMVGQDLLAGRSSSELLVDLGVWVASVRPELLLTQACLFKDRDELAFVLAGAYSLCTARYVDGVDRAKADERALQLRALLPAQTAERLMQAARALENPSRPGLDKYLKGCEQVKDRVALILIGSLSETLALLKVRSPGKHLPHFSNVKRDLMAFALSAKGMALRAELATPAERK